MLCQSINLKDYEKNYATHDLELVAIVHALNMWRNYLIIILFYVRYNIVDPEEEFVVCTDACKQGLGGVVMQDNHVV